MANDRTVGEVIVIPGGEAQQIRYLVDVDRGFLTQVFYTTWEGESPRVSPEVTRGKEWGLSAIEIEQAVPPAGATQPSTRKSD